MEDAIGSRPTQDASRTLPGLLARAAVPLVGLIAAGLLAHSLPSFRQLLLSRTLLDDGWRGWIIFLGAGTLIGAFGLPRQAVGFAAGYVFGVLPGIVLTTVAGLLASLVDLLWARLVGRPWVLRRLQRGRMARLDGFVAANPFTAILTLRLLPVGSSLLVSLLAGVLGVRLPPFLAATLLGSLPQTVVFVLAGSGSRIGHLAQIAIAIGLFATSALLGVAMFRRASPIETEASS